MPARIKIQIPGQPPAEVMVEGLLSIGRSSSSGIVVRDNRVSRNHAVIQQHGNGTHYVLDLGSSNGTFVNGRRVTVPVALKSRDIVNVGNASMEYVCDDPSAAGGTTSDVKTVVDFQSRKVTILVADVRDFTSFSEKMPPTELSMLMGSWFKEVATLIDQHGGMIDKFIGDCVMAYWIKAQTDENVDYVIQPLTASLALVGLAGIFSDRFRDKLPDHEFKIGVGVQMGEAVIGNVGIAGPRDFTAMGDCVNTAFRLESSCKKTGKTIVVGPEIAALAQARFAFEDLGLLDLKGKNEPLQAYALKACKE